jgi:hypothetical protein
VIGIATRMPQFAGDFLRDTGLHAKSSSDVQLLRSVFKFIDPPYGVALENGREKAAIISFDVSEPAKTLRQVGFVE